MSEIRYEEGGSEFIDRIETLWLNLNQHHIDRTPFFSEAYKNKTFQSRKTEMIVKSNGGKIRTDIAYVLEMQMPIGYCISIVHPDIVGEVESLVVDNRYRGLGIGEELMQRALSWMDSYHVKNKRLEVYFGNEEVFNFYRRFGFYPKYIVLEQKK